MKTNEYYTIFEYNPQGERLILKTNEKIRYDFENCKYFIDQNPFGNEKLVEIYDLKFIENYNSVTFNTIYKKKEKTIKLIGNNKIDKILYKLFFDIANKNICIKENELDQIEIVVLNNKLETIYIYKFNEEFELINTLRIITKNMILYYEEVEPEYKLYECDKIKVENKKFTIITKEKTIEYFLDIQNTIYNIIEEIIVNI